MLTPASACGRDRLGGYGPAAAADETKRRPAITTCVPSWLLIGFGAIRLAIIIIAGLALGAVLAIAWVLSHLRVC